MKAERSRKFIHSSFLKSDQNNSFAGDCFAAKMINGGPVVEALQHLDNKTACISQRPMKWHA